MDKDDLLLIGAFFFALIAFMHLLRSVMRWSVTVGSFNIPAYLSYAVVLVFGYISWEMYSSSKK